jgi:uncharacterized protein
MLNENDINKIKEKIIANINPLKIYIFGSYARNQAREDSDLDLFIEVDNSQDIFKAKLQLNFLFGDRRIPMDFLVETRELVERNRSNRASFYYNMIADEARLIYERE